MQQKLTLKIVMLAIMICLASATPGFSEISVYDANNQYLGVLFGDGTPGWGGGNEIAIFIPQLGVTGIFESDGNLSKSFYFVFETDDCSGTLYCDIPLYQYVAIQGCGSTDIYYAVTNKFKSFIPKSYYSSYDCKCQKIVTTIPGNYSEVSVFPLFPFTLPVARPLHFKFTSGCDINGDGKTGLEEAVNALQITSGLKNPGPPVGGTK